MEPGISTLQQQLAALFPGEDINLSYSDEALVMSGRVSSTQVMLRAGEIATASSGSLNVINMLQVPGGDISQQVMLQVRVAEINRSALFEAGFSFFSNARVFSRTTTQQFAAPDFEEGGLVFSDFLNIFMYDSQEGVGAACSACSRRRGMFRSLAEPNLIAYNGQEASFLAGGEFPVPIVQGTTGGVTVQFKEFGVRLTFTPTIAGDVIRSEGGPGGELAGLQQRHHAVRLPDSRAHHAAGHTDVELRDGQSFAIAGLLDTTTQNDRASMPILSAIPVIGSLFKSRADRSEETELMVLITPRLVQPLEPDEVPPLPTDELSEQEAAESRRVSSRTRVWPMRPSSPTRGTSAERRVHGTRGTAKKGNG